MLSRELGWIIILGTNADTKTMYFNIDYLI